MGTIYVPGSSVDPSRETRSLYVVGLRESDVEKLDPLGPGTLSPVGGGRTRRDKVDRVWGTSIT